MRRRTEGVMFGSELETEGGTRIPAFEVEHVIERLEPMVTEARKARLLKVLSRRLSSVTVVVDGLHDPHNGSAILRSCDAFGVHRLHAVERSEPFAAARSVSRGSQKWVDLVRYSSVASCVERLRASGHELVATHPEGELLPADLASIPKLAIVLGNEHFGIAPELAAACARSVRVPMSGFVESLNVSVTAAILLHAASSNRPGDLEHSTLRAAYARGLMLSVSRAEERLGDAPSGPAGATVAETR